MIISTHTAHIFDKFGYEEGIKMAAELGFDALDFTMCENMDNEEFSEENYIETAKKLKKYAEDNSIYFNQAHAPYPFYMAGKDEYNKEVYPKIVRSIKIAGILGVNQIIVHPAEYKKEPEQMKFNLDFYNKLLPIAKEAGVKIGIENMWGYNWDTMEIIPNVCSNGYELAMYLDHLDKNYFTVCLDIGHTILTGQKPDEAIYEIGGERLGALHVNDNGGKDDDHIIPYAGVIDWKAVMAALKKIGYKGDFTYEVVPSVPRKDSTKESVYKGLQDMVKVAKELIAEFEG